MTVIRDNGGHGPSRRAWLRDSVWSTVGFAAIAAGSFALSVIVARSLSTEDSGAFFVCQSMIAAAAMLLRLGQDQVVVRDVALTLRRVSGRASNVQRDTRRHSDEVIEAAWRPFALVCGISVPIALVLGLVGVPRVFDGPIPIPQLTPFAGVIAALLVMEVVRLVLSESARGAGAIGASVVLGDPGRVGLFVGLLVCCTAVANLDLATALYLGAAASATLVVCSAVWVCIALGRPTRRFERGWVVPQMSEGSAVGVGAFAALVISQCDVWFVASGFGTSEAAYYSAAVRVAFFLTAPLLILNRAVGPRIAVGLHEDRPRLQRQLRMGVVVATGAATVALLFVLVFADALLSLLFGGDFAAGAAPLRVLAISQWANVAFGPCALILVMAGRSRLLLGSAIIWAAVTAGACFGASHVSPLAVAFASASGTVLFNVCNAVLVRSSTGLWAGVDPRTIGRDVRYILAGPGGTN